ncbi:23212_t:CDS:2 [Gigaspora rosea]|nr:23212_t:CDS:2 [Gigaspora rosea]
MAEIFFKNLGAILAGKLIEDTKITNTFFKDLVEDFKNLYETKEYHDTIITVGEEPNVEQIPAHSVILCTRSSYFHSALSDRWAERKDVDLKNQEAGIILELLVATDEVLIHQLTYFVQDFLIKNRYIFLKRCPVKILNFIAQHERFNELREVYLETICKYPLLLFDSEEFPLLEEDALKLILKCDNLDVKECIIWKKLVKWGFAQHATLENKMACRDTRIDRKEIIPEVWDYKDILPNDLMGNFKSNSKLINREIALLFTKWIDEKTIGNKTSKGFRYKFNLLFRGSLDGGSSKKFHQKCDNKGATILVAVIQNSSLLVGGYNPLDWNGDTCKQTISSFLFILDYNDITNAIVSRVNRNNSRFAIGCFNSYGPCFGEGPD